MPSNKLFTNLITGTAIVASLTTGGMAGLKVFANRNVESEVPELTTVSPSPTATIIPMSPANIVETPSVAPSTSPSASPSIAPISSDFPIASMVPGGQFDDDNDDEDNELEHQENEEEEEDEHESNENKNRQDD